ncbi:MAG: hypothetical protein E3K37_11170 [Candidatus Kuenenia sp.]|nr:hypothetical protein [Candidatus Kuenenia hertensis]
MVDKSQIVYSLNVEDIQTVAIQEIGRELTEDEIEKVKNSIMKKSIGMTQFSPGGFRSVT